jgi:hypothetical protein
MHMRVGDVVEVLPKEQVLATLATDGAVDKMPFMPEMLQYCGRRFRISKVAHKTCDTAYKTGARWVDDCYHLENLRCDGQAHGGCQAGCLLFFKGAWLRKVDSLGSAPLAADSSAGPIPEILQRATLHPTEPGLPVRYACQTTRLYDATRPLHWWDVRQYVLDLSSGNVAPGVMLKVLVLSWFRALTRLPVAYRATTALYRFAHRFIVGGPAPMGSGLVPSSEKTPTGELNLAPGESVVVKSHLEIRKTLNQNNKNRGLWFDEEYVQFCGTTQRVSHRVFRILDERSGEMVQMKNPCIVLEGVQCESRYSLGRLFCPRAISAYWRENWLERPGDKNTSA